MIASPGIGKFIVKYLKNVPIRVFILKTRGFFLVLFIRNGTNVFGNAISVIWFLFMYIQSIFFRIDILIVSLFTSLWLLSTKFVIWIVWYLYRMTIFCGTSMDTKKEESQKSIRYFFPFPWLTLFSRYNKVFF